MSAQPADLRHDPMADAEAGIERVADSLHDLVPLLAAVTGRDNQRVLLRKLHIVADQATFVRRSVARREAGLPDDMTGGAA